MKVTEFKISYSRTVRPADFESKSCSMEVHVVLDDGEDVRKVSDAVVNRLKQKVEGALGIGPAVTEEL